MSPASVSRLKPWLAFTACTLIWGSTFLFISIGNDTVPPVWGAALRLGLATPVLLALLALRGERPPRGGALRAAAGFGAFQFGLNFPLLYWGQQWVPSGLSSVLFGTIPLVSALLAPAFGIERLTPRKLGGALVALAGVGAIFSGQLTRRVPPLPLVSVLLAVVAACLGTILLKRGPRQSPVGANAVGAVVGLAICLGVSAAAGEPWRVPATWPALYPILYLAMAGSVGAFVIMSWLVNHWPVTRIGYISVVSPLVAVMLGTVVRHERLPPASLAGSVLVGVGLLLGLRAERGADDR